MFNKKLDEKLDKIIAQITDLKCDIAVSQNNITHIRTNIENTSTSVKLPCLIGDTVYIIRDEYRKERGQETHIKKVVPAHIDRFIVSNIYGSDFYDINICADIYTTDNKLYTGMIFGEDYFISKSAAEKYAYTNNFNEPSVK